MALLTRTSPLLALHKKQVEEKGTEPKPAPAVESAKPVSSFSALQAALSGKKAAAPSTPQVEVPKESPTETPSAPAPIVPAVAERPKLSPPPVGLEELTPAEAAQLVKTVEVPAANLEELIVGFKANCDKLNELILADTGLSPYTVDAAKGFVRQIMIDLRDQPELDSCIIDRDVHNILTFIRRVKYDAAEAQAEVKTKKAKAESKKKTAFGGMRIDLSKLPALGKKDIGNLET